MHVRYSIGVLGLAVLFAGCGPRVDYIGQNYPPTIRVDVFMDAKDIARPHKVMGRATVTASSGTRAGLMQDTLMEEARMRGADAVLIEGLDTMVTGESVNWHESETTTGRAKTEEKRSSRKTREREKTIETTDRHGHGATSVTREKTLRASFLKYQ